MMNDQQQARESKAVYSTPSIKEYGAVADLVASQGTGAIDDGSGAAQYAS